MTTLILYIVLNGSMKVTRIPTPDMAACQATAAQLAPTLKALHHECKTAKAKKTTSKL